MNRKLTRRKALRQLGASAAVLTATTALPPAASAAQDVAAFRLKGHIRHSVCRWCYSKIPLDNLCQQAKGIGIESVDLLETQDFPTLRKYDLVCAMVSGVPGGITSGLNRLENHDRIVEFFERTAPVVAAHGYPNIICFSGNCDGMGLQEGMDNCLAGVKRIVPIVEKYKVTACMELLNSKRNHKDYMCDHSAWGVELCRRVGSERFKLLYDIYHMQIMEGDLVDTVRENHSYFAHYHTGGVPGRGEIDDSQEIHYPAVMRAIYESGFKGFVAQEFVPKRPDAIASLRECVLICDI